MTKRLSPFLLAVLCGSSANIFLGASSLYWRELYELSPQVLVAYRVLLSLLTLTALICLNHGFHKFKTFSIRTLCLHSTASMLVAINWGTFIWASLHGHILESGLGYLIAPFLTIAMGVIFYREKLKTAQTISMLIVLVAAMLLVVNSNELNHWVYSLIGVSWGSYAALKKATVLEAMDGLFVETLFLTFAVAMAVALFDWSLAWPETLTFRAKWLVLLAGGVSVLPLMMFTYAIKTIPLSLAGFFQFILPITQLVVAVCVYKQPVSMNALLVFLAIAGVLASLLAYELTTKLHHR